MKEDMNQEVHTTKTIDFSNRFFTVLNVLMLAALISSLGTMVYQFKSLPQNHPQDIAVTGEGKAYAKPDIAVVQFGVHTQGEQSQAVVNENNKIMNNALAAVTGLGIEAKDIRTTLYTLTPLYDYTETGRIFKGYSLDQQVQVKIRNFDKISEVLDKATSSGINTISDLQFTVDDIEKVRAQARAEAIAQAKSKARVLFRQTGLHAVKLVNVSEGGFGCYGICPQPAFGLGGAAKDAATIAPEIQPGQTEVLSSVTLTYRVK